MKGREKEKKINISFSQNPKHIWRDAKISMTQFCLQKIDAHFKHITHSQNCLNWDWFYGHCNNMLSNAITSPQSKPADKNPHKIIHEALKKNTFFSVSPLHHAQDLRTVLNIMILELVARFA